MSQALTFNDVTLSPVTHQNNLWIRAVELARALGYSDTRKVTHLYERNSDEFTPDMTQVIEIPEVPELGTSKNLVTKARIFSLRGCHLLAMFARTPVAKAFRRWVLDVLDRLAAEERAALPEVSTSDTLTPEQQAQLQAIVQAKVRMLPRDVQRKAYAEMWTRFGQYFRIARYAQLPPAKMGEAVEYLVGLEIKATKALPPTDKEYLSVAPAVPKMEIATPAADIDGHLAAIREHIRRIRDHEEAIFLAARKAMPLRGVGPSISLASLIHRNMENVAWSLHYALESMEASARIVVVAGRG